MVGHLATSRQSANRRLPGKMDEYQSSGVASFAVMDKNQFKSMISGWHDMHTLQNRRETDTDSDSLHDDK